MWDDICHFWAEETNGALYPGAFMEIAVNPGDHGSYPVVSFGQLDEDEADQAAILQEIHYGHGESTATAPEDGRDLWSFPLFHLPVCSGSGGRFGGTRVVPAGCRALT
jgi:hypothetical protein